MIFFTTCPKCKAAVVQSEGTYLCFQCKAALDKSALLGDDFDKFVDEYKDKVYYEWDDIQRLVHAVEYLTEINNNVCVQLGQCLLEIEKLRDRVEWYRQITSAKLV